MIKYLANKVWFDLMVIMPFMSIIVFYAIHNDYWAPAIFTCVGYVASWIAVWTWKKDK